jgi:hypothetical protein
MPSEFVHLARAFLDQSRREGSNVEISTHMTVREIADALGYPAWLVRKIVDALDPQCLRVGQYRAVPREMLGQIQAKLAKRRGRGRPRKTTPAEVVA